MKFFILIALASVLFVIRAWADTVLRVGAQAEYHTISAAVNAADRDSDPTHYYVITVVPGVYTNDFPHVTRALTIEVDPSHVGQDVILKATTDVPNRKGIIVNEANLLIDGLTFVGAKISNDLGGNAAGIRDENTSRSASLTVHNSKFIHNQTGILTAPNPSESITITDSFFKDNGNPTITGGPLCCQHALYVGKAGALTVNNTLFCGQLIGHDIKSRALSNTISENTIYDGAASNVKGCDPGTASFAIDLPNGGRAKISKNQIIKGSNTGNTSIIALGEEGLVYQSNSAYIFRNSFENKDGQTVAAIFDPHCIPVQLIDNKFSGIETIINPVGCEPK